MTIQRAVDMAQPGDTVYVHEGTYHESVRIKSSGTQCAPILIAGFPRERPVIDGEYELPTGPDAVCDPVSGNCFTYNALVNIEGSYVVFEGFEVTRSRGRGIRIWRGAIHDIIRDCWVHETRYGGIMLHHSEYHLIESNRVAMSANYCTYSRPSEPLVWPGAIQVKQGNHSIVRGNHVYNNWGEGIVSLETNDLRIEDNVVYDNWRTGIHLNTVGYVTVQRNLLYHTGASQFVDDNPPSGIMIATDYRGVGLSTDHTIVNNIVVGHRHNFSFWWTDPPRGALINTVIANNTFVNPVAGDPTRATNIYIMDHPDHRNVRIENNIFLQNTEAAPAEVPDDPAFHWSNNLWSTSPPAQASGPGDIVSDAQLLNPDAPLVPGNVNAEWYKLRASSPAIDSAKVIGEVSDDFFGSERGLNPDLGAHEYE